MTTQTETKPQRPLVTLLYKGVCELASGKLGHEYVEITGEPEETLAKTQTGKCRIYDKALLKFAQPGTIVTVECGPENPGNSVYPATSKFIKLWPNAAERATWQAASRAVQDSFEARKESLKLMKRDELERCLEPLVRAYGAARTRQQKRLLIAAVVETITSGRELL